MAFRKKMSRSRSRRLFKKTVSRVHKKNFSRARIRRGGFRL